VVNRDHSSKLFSITAYIGLASRHSVTIFASCIRRSCNQHRNAGLLGHVSYNIGLHTGDAPTGNVHMPSIIAYLWAINPLYTWIHRHFSLVELSYARAWLAV